MSENARKDQPRVHTPAERINQLNSIDKDVAKLLNSAGQAVQALTRAQQSNSEAESSAASLEDHKAAFSSAASQYFSLLSSIDVRLRRQIYALEEADIVPADAPLKENVQASGAPSAQAATERSSNVSTALGNLDIGWLNSRKDTVGKEMEAELWARASDFIKQLQKEKLQQARQKPDGDSNPGMDVAEGGTA